MSTTLHPAGHPHKAKAATRIAHVETPDRISAVYALDDLTALYGDHAGRVDARHRGVHDALTRALTTPPAA